MEKPTDRRFNDTAQKVAEHLEKGLTVLEIARLLSISPNAVYKHIHRYDLQLPTKDGEKAS